VDVSINAGNMMYFLPIHRLKEMKKYDEVTLLRLLDIYLDEMVHIHFGQGWDIVWHSYYIKENKIPTEAQYIQMVSHKTGVLPRMLTRMTSLVCGLDAATAQKLSTFSERIGLAFQIQDDILNLTESELTKGKGYLGEDIHEVTYSS
jgi:geranylgeranyl diphosphate synthase type 3